MEIRITTEILEGIFTHVMTAEYLTDYIHSTVVGGALTKSINEISRIIAGLLGKPATQEPAKEPAPDGKIKFDFANAFDDLRLLVMKTDALVTTVESLFENMSWVEIDRDTRQFEHLAHLISATSHAVREAMEVGDMLAVGLVTQRNERNGIS